MLKKEYSVDLFNRKGNRSQSFNSGSYVIYYGTTAQHSYIEDFPQGIDSKAEKQEFLEGRINYLRSKRIERNQRRVDIEIEKYLGIYESKVTKPKKPKKPVKPKKPEKPRKIIGGHRTRKPATFKIGVTKKKARGVFKATNFEFRHSILRYDKPMLVTGRDKAKFEKLRARIKEDFKKLIKKAYTYKGERRFIVKLITPFYDGNGNLMFSDELEEKDELGNKTGKVTIVPTKYSYGYSLGRTMRYGREEMLNNEVDFLLDEWELDLTRKYEGLTSKIELSALMVEEVVSESKRGYNKDIKKAKAKKKKVKKKGKKKAKKPRRR